MVDIYPNSYMIHHHDLIEDGGLSTGFHRGYFDELICYSGVSGPQI